MFKPQAALNFIPIFRGLGYIQCLQKILHCWGCWLWLVCNKMVSMVVSCKRDATLIIIYHRNKLWNLCSIIEIYYVLWTYIECQLQPRNISKAPVNNAEISLRVTTTILAVEALRWNSHKLNHIFSQVQ